MWSKLVLGLLFVVACVVQEGTCRAVRLDDDVDQADGDYRIGERAAVAAKQTDEPVDISKTLRTPAEFQQMLVNAGRKPVIVMYHSPGCPLCRALEPSYKELAKRLAGKAEFKIFDIVANEMLTGPQGIKLLPTWQFYIGGTKLREIGGPGEQPANKEVLVDNTEATLLDAAKMDGEEARLSQEIKDVAAMVKKGNAARNFGNMDSDCLKRRRQTPRPIEQVVIIGTGPAGLSAAIYAGRSGLCPLVIAASGGGQLEKKGALVENYAGVLNATGDQLIDGMEGQVAPFDGEIWDDRVTSVDFTRGRDPSKPLLFRTKANGDVWADAAIVATGSSANQLNVPGEQEYYGQAGVSNCANCDGHQHKDKRCMVVGGGDSAAEDVFTLARVCSEVIMVHRRDKLRAQDISARRLMSNPKVKFMWNSEVVKFEGNKPGSEGGVLVRAIVRDKTTNADTPVPLSGAFVAIGHSPTSALFRGALTLDERTGHVMLYNGGQMTNVPGVYAAGDVADVVYRQAITSAGTGAAAAIDVDRWLAHNRGHSDPAEGSATPPQDPNAQIVACFKNDGSRSVAIVWIKPDTGEQMELINPLAPGENKCQYAHPLHIFGVRDGNQIVQRYSIEAHSPSTVQFAWNAY